MNTNELKRIMSFRGDKQQDLANWLEISLPTFNLKLNGKYDFKQTEIKKIAERYDLTNEEIKSIFLN